MCVYHGGEVGKSEKMPDFGTLDPKLQSPTRKKKALIRTSQPYGKCLFFATISSDGRGINPSRLCTTVNF
jgi:hypothetical protein